MEAKWISVKDRLPETNLGASFKYSEVVAVLTTDVNYPTTARLERGTDLYSEPYWYDLLNDATDVQVTHWLLLPESPNKL